MLVVLYPPQSTAARLHRTLNSAQTMRKAMAAPATMQRTVMMLWDPVAK